MAQRGVTASGSSGWPLKSREVIIRSDGRVRYVVLTPLAQLRLGGLAFLAVVVLLAACGGLIYAQITPAPRQILVVEPTTPDPRYSALARDVRAVLASRVAVTAQAGSSDAVWLTAALRALDAQRRAGGEAVAALLDELAQLQQARDVLEAKTEAARAELAAHEAKLQLLADDHAAALAASVALGERLRAAEIRLAGAGPRRELLQRGAGLLRASLTAAGEIAAHGLNVERGYAARVAAVGAELASVLTTHERLQVQLAAAREKLATAAGPKHVALAAKRGVDLIEYLFPLHDLPLPEEITTAPPEPALILAIVRQESRFSHKAVSPAGAAGLMQLMPATAAQFADKLDLAYDKETLLDPEANVAIGSAYLEHLIRYYGGSYILALAAYNAGPARVGQWLKEYGDPRLSPDDPMLWVDMIPFRETRLYVTAVMYATQVYRYRLDGPRPGDGLRPPLLRY
jgi:soluble lytic murein transglycosylase-like protein